MRIRITKSTEKIEMTLCDDDDDDNKVYEKK